MRSQANDNQWELCKENVAPLKRGRSVKGLSDQLASNPVADSGIHEAQERAFEQGIEDAIAGEASGASSKEILDKFVIYYKWTRDTYPSKTEKALQLLERCTVALKDDLAMKNDNKFVKLWIEYADMVRLPGEVFSFMQSNKIGERNALFWVAWAFVAEKAENYKLTDQIFQKGIKKLAEPKEILQKRYQQFQRRLARHYLNLADTGAVHDAALPAVVAPSARSALSTVALKEPKQSSSASRSKPSVVQNSTGFAIFTDPGTAEPGQLRENSGWKVLGTEEQKRKENDGPATKWTDAPLRAPINTRPAAAAAPAIQIFVDPEVQSAEPVHGPKVRDTKQQVLAIRKQLDGLRDVATNPLAIHKLASLAKPPAETLPVESATAETPTAPSFSSLPFTIFSDAAPVTAAAPIVDENASKSTRQESKIPTIKPAAKSMTALSATMPSYSTLTDGSSSSQQPSSHRASREKTSGELEHEQELNSILKELDVLDSADGTINTRLARKDIDSMFCSSPSPVKVQAKRGAAQPAYTTHQPMVCELSAIQESSREYSIFGQLHSPAQDTSAKKPRSGDGSDVNGSMYISDSSSSSQNDSASRQVPPLVSNVPAPNPISGDSLMTFVSRCERQINSCSLHAAKAVCARREEPRAAAVVAEDATELPVAKAAPEPCTVLFDPFKVESAVKNQWQLLLPFIELYWPVHDCRDIGATPSVLRYRQSVPRGSSLSALGRSFDMEATLGRGGYGHAIRCSAGGELVVLKVDLRIYSVVWEAHIHAVLALRAERLATLGIGTPSERCLLPPQGLLLYEGASVLVMPCANMGTLVDVINTASMLGSLLPAAEHELLCALVASRMLSALRLLHSCDVIHTDIKCDNWVFHTTRMSTGAATLEVFLIDLGKAKDVKPSPDGCKTLFAGGGGVGSYACPEMGQGVGWSRCADYYGLAACLHQLIFFSPLETTHGRQGCGEFDGVVVPTAALKRYWNRPVWSRLYGLLLNSDDHTHGALEALRGDIDMWLGRQQVQAALGCCLAKICRVKK